MSYIRFVSEKEHPDWHSKPSNTHTIADLWEGVPTRVVDGQILPVEPYIARHPFRLIFDDRCVGPYEWGSRLSSAYFDYKARAASNSPWWKPELKTKFDRLRWKLHRQLLKWKVIV